MFYFVLLIMTWNYTKHCISHKNNQTAHVQPPNNYLALFFMMTQMTHPEKSQDSPSVFSLPYIPLQISRFHQLKWTKLHWIDPIRDIQKKKHTQKIRYDGLFSSRACNWNSIHHSISRREVIKEILASFSQPIQKFHHKFKAK